MADPGAIVEMIVKLGLQIKDAGKTVPHYNEECQEIKKHMLRLNDILLVLQQTGMMNDRPAMRAVLVDLEESVQHALEVVTACQEASAIRCIIAASRDLSKQLRRAKVDILNRVLLASFAITIHTIMTGVHPHLPSQQPEDAGLVEESHSIESTNDARSQSNDVQTNVLAGTEPSFAVDATFVDVVAAGFETILLQTQKHRKLVNINSGGVLKAVGIGMFTKRQLKNITSSYSDRIGGGFFSDVYKGIIKDDGGQDKHVAVKCTAMARLPPHYVQKEAGMDGFMKEITLQFQMKHRNMVRLIGFCLETDVPILVYEFISNGSLEDKLHSANKFSSLSLLQRLHIAIGSAEALSYMHSHGEYSHVHGDVKPANILLDENLNAKISDFGSSKLLSVKKYVKDVSADRNYADPVYIMTGHFTVKSDVYSFGVVLLELITRKKARYNGDCSLPMDFEKSWNDKIKRRSMYDTDILFDDQHLIKCLDMVGALAVRCLSTERDERPTMGEVLAELRIVKSIASGGHLN